jgi:transposase
MTTDLTYWAKARASDISRLTQSTASLRQAVRDAVAAGMSESEAARQAGVSRLTIRAWLGK